MNAKTIATVVLTIFMGLSTLQTPLAGQSQEIFYSQPIGKASLTTMPIGDCEYEADLNCIDLCGGTWVWMAQANVLGGYTPIQQGGYTFSFVPGSYNVQSTEGYWLNNQWIPCWIVWFWINEVNVTTTTTCSTGANGTARATGHGGTSPYTYLWSNGATTATATGLAPGTYTVTVTDANDCQIIKTVQIQSCPNCQTVQTNLTAIICADESYLFDGEELSQSGIYTANRITSLGCDSIVYLDLTVLPNVSETVNATICAGETFAGYTMTGSYTDHFTSSNGCDSTRVLNLTVRELPNVSVQVTQPTCELSLGSITILGDPIFFYDWDNGADGQVQDSLPAGTYNVSVTDLHGCMVELVPIVLNEPIGSDTTWVNLQSCDSDELGVFIETFGTNGCDSVVVRTVTRGLDCTPRRICNIVVTTNGQSVFVNIKDDIAEGLQIERWDYSIIPNSQVTTARHAATGHWTVKGHHEVQIPMNLRLADANDYFVVCIIATTEEINGKREEFYVVPPNSPDEVIKMGVKVF